jgi:TatA/E family protein of Tat protein translocase|tara:strand:- start:184 stop:402 length:219 start_codon:yes stop_codon:yes gene_type:complete
MTASLALLGPLGPPEILIILGILLFLFGAKKLPELARGMGRSLGEFKKGKEEFEEEIVRAQDEVTTEDEKKS